jgi:hypothetical protein
VTRDRPSGLILFLPVPVVLFLFTQAPLGPVLSLVVGVALMATHRLYARPFALARAGRRCLWCGGAASPDGPELEVDEPSMGFADEDRPVGATRWRACRDAHAARARRFLTWAGAHSRFVLVGILGSLVLFLALAGLAAFRPGGALRHADAVNVFRLGIAATVLPLSTLGGREGAPGADRRRTPFPIHIQALIGTAAVIWLFRIVGAAWLVLSILYFARRLA